VRAPKSPFFTALGNLPILCTAYRKVNFTRQGYCLAPSFGCPIVPNEVFYLRFYGFHDHFGVAGRRQSDRLFRPCLCAWSPSPLVRL